MPNVQELRGLPVFGALYFILYTVTKVRKARAEDFFVFMSRMDGKITHTELLLRLTNKSSVLTLLRDWNNCHGNAHLQRPLEDGGGSWGISCTTPGISNHNTILVRSYRPCNYNFTHITTQYPWTRTIVFIFDIGAFETLCRWAS